MSIPFGDVERGWCASVAHIWHPRIAAHLQDVARAAGVGSATVDRVLNQRPGVSGQIHANDAWLDDRRADSIVFVGHALTPAARANLLSGTMDAVIDQDAAYEIRSALRLAMARIAREFKPAQGPSQSRLAGRLQRFRAAYAPLRGLAP